MFITEINAAGSSTLYNGVLAGNATPCPPIPPGAPETCGNITALTSILFT
jgi:hypothetical protein